MSKAHILIIDDDKDLVRKYTEILTKADYSVGYAYDGQEGLGKLKTQEADLVILDIKMPRMNGIKVLEAIRDDEALRKTKVLVISSYAYKAAGRKAGKVGSEKGGWKGRIKVRSKQDVQEKEIPGKRHGIDVTRIRKLPLERWLADEVERALQAKPQAIEREKQGNEPDGVLIVDDDKEIVEKIASWLKPERYELLFAYNGAEALEKLSKEPIDLVILDLNMPDTTGEDVIRIMRSIPVVDNIPIIEITSGQDTTTYKDLFGIYPGTDIIDENNIRSRIHRYKYNILETYDKPQEDKLSSLLHLDKPRLLLARIKKELAERRRLGCSYLKQPITILRNKKGMWLEGYLEGYVIANMNSEYPCSYCEEKRMPAYQDTTFYPSQYLCEGCTKELKARYPSFA